MAKAKKLAFIFLIYLLALMIVGCKDKNITISISGSSTIQVGQTATLGCTVLGSEETVFWSSSDESVLTVKQTGEIEALKEGKSTITASIGKHEDSMEITVEKKPQITEKLFCGINQITTSPKCYDKVEFAVLERNIGYVKENFNPFDYSKLYVYGVFTSPSGKVIMAPAFWYRDYSITLNTSMKSGTAKEGEPDGLEMVNWISDDYEYRIRFQPDEEGSWTYNIYVTIEGVVNDTFNGRVEVQDSTEEYKGLIKVNKSNNKTFMYEDGTTFMPIGENMAWYDRDKNYRKTYDYQVWFKEANENNMNIARIWLAPWGFCLHWGKSMYDYTDRLNYAARLDRLIELADEYDMYLMLTLLNHGQFSSNTDSTWDQNPYNKKNGGVLTNPQNFFTNAICKETYKNELLYIIGRYGYSDNIMCWELFNEVDWTDNASINALNIKNWHKEMAQFIRNNDSYNHMITTSYKTEYGDAFRLEEIDFACPHSYGYAGKNICDSLPSVLDKLYNQYKKPILHAEIGIDWQNGITNYRLDPTGISLRQASFAGMMGGGAGGAMNWWWDSYVHPYGLYYQFKGAGAYAKLLNLNGSDYTQLRTLSGVSVSSPAKILGYRFDNRVYGYLYDVNWKYNNAVSDISGISVNIPFTDGSYNLKFYDTLTGELISTSPISVSGGKLTFSCPKFSEDLAFIVE